MIIQTITFAHFLYIYFQEYNAKLSDFGLAKDGPEGDKTHVSTRDMGTYGYAAPEYVMTGESISCCPASYYCSTCPENWSKSCMMLSLLFCPVTASVSYTSIIQCMLDRLKFIHS